MSEKGGTPDFRIQLQEVSQRFRFQWVFRKLSLDFRSGSSYAILGPNGAGKSTLLRILCGHLTPSRGRARFTAAGRELSPEEVFRYISFTGPYMELIEEYTLVEAIRFHRRFKPFQHELSESDVLELTRLPRSSRDKEVRFFSSGMKQRLKLSLAILSESKALLLDEPSTNLDRKAVAWYHDLIRQYAGERLLVVASNVEEDYAFCDEYVEVKSGR